MYEHILQKGHIGKLEIKNRLVMPGMGNRHFSEDGHATDETAEYFAARAKGGYGLIIDGYTAIEDRGWAGPYSARISSDEFIPGFKHVTDRVHEEAPDCKMFMQLQHCGRQTSSKITGIQPVAASAIPCPVMRDLPRELRTAEVYELIDKFAAAAVRAQKAGYDGVEVHAGHGYLVANFMSSYTNKRTDEFGGDIEGRAKFCVEIIKAIKRACGKDFPISVRISGEEMVESGRLIDETVVLARLIEAAGADVLNISYGTYAVLPYMVPPSQVPTAFAMKYAEAVKKVVKIPVITVGRFNDPTFIDAVIEDGRADFVATGRAAIADPEFPNKIAAGKTREISPCVGCVTRCGETEGLFPEQDHGGVSCAWNPFSGHELTMKIEPAEKKKKIVVVGAGPGGLEAAWVSAARGHEVILLEKHWKAGGQVLAACMPPYKHEMARAIRYYVTMCEKNGVDVRYNTEATADMILSLEPDAVILATGAKALIPNIENAGIPICTAYDLVTGQESMGENNLIVGGGIVGLETAEYILNQGRKATVLEMSDHTGEGLANNVAYFMYKNLEEHHCQLKTEHKVLRLTTDGAICETPDGEVSYTGFDKAVIAVGSRPQNQLYGELEGKVPELYILGDAVKVGRVHISVEQAARLAIKI